jgi:hypothetical protein
MSQLTLIINPSQFVVVDPLPLSTTTLTPILAQLHEKLSA